ncbi:zinc-binding dehydrogenase [Tuberibacillus sp. Marseille-P3662]|uniref:zinc-binding dehydrogenase n=1 Tax=Tuberibacillus sp. Marseille-P3662 TaxID=1965358 RepID=UPI000A1C8D31|nr:zinc-binding dehydrogenase [Tuberibacillus sp. Marseille-P3662]
MKAIVHNGESGYAGLEYSNTQQPEVKKNEVRVRLKAAGLNHRDLFVLNRHTTEHPPLVIGSDGAGVIESVGTGVGHVHPGDDVVIIPSLGWNEKSDAPPKGFEILGFPDNGTFAEYVTVPADNVVKKPAYLEWDEAGVLPLGALTAYRALVTRAEIQDGQTVFIPGIGSGVATYLLQFAKAKGARVIVTSRHPEKLAQAVEIGADLAINTNDDWAEALQDEEIDIVIDSVGAATWQRSLEVLKKGGTIVVFGASAGDEITLNLRDFFYGQYNLLGSTMGSGEEFRDMIQFIEAHHIRPVVDSVVDLQDVKQAMDKLEDSSQFGKLGIKISD